MEQDKKLPRYVYLPFFLIVSLQFITYYLSQIITKNSHAYDLTITAFDNKVPLVTFFIVFYILSYPWWFISPFVVAWSNNNKYLNWSLALIICFIICGFIYTFLPTTITRPVINNNNIFDYLTNLIYQADSPGNPRNLFPSYHCLISWFCYMGVRNDKKIAPWYRFGSLIFAILICLSTQFIKQHYIVDLIGGIFLAEVVYFIVKKYNLGRIFHKNVRERKFK